MKNKTILLVLILLITIPVITSAQRWKRSRYELLGGAGPSSFFGDLGGANKDGVHFMGDMDLPATRFHLLLGVRYKIKEKAALRLNLIYARIHGSDAYTESGRTFRNVTFSSGLFEPSVQFEYSLIKEKLGTRYTFQNLQRFKLVYVNTYVFIGLGGVLFNPKLNWIAPTNKNEKFSRFNLAIPLGIGFKYAINRRACLGLEFGMRYTSTDYLDGHSDKYSKANDAYSFLNLNVTYKLKTARSGLPKF